MAQGEVDHSVSLENAPLTNFKAPIIEKTNTGIEEDGEAATNQGGLCLPKRLLWLTVEAPAKSKTETYEGDLFIVDIVDARQALSHAEQVWEIWLTNPESKYNASDEKKRSFLTLWISETLGKELGKKSKAMSVN